MTQVPPPPVPPMSPPQYQPPMQPKSNGFAVASLICGILGCIPAITSLLAVVFGIVGIQKSRQPGAGGKGLSIAGIILGVLGIILWSGGAIVLFTAPTWIPGLAKRAIVPAATQAARPFVQSLASNDLSTAGSYTDMSQESLSSLADQVKSYGSFQSIAVDDINFETTDDSADVVVVGSATFSSGTKKFHATISGGRNGGGIKFKDFKFD